MIMAFPTVHGGSVLRDTIWRCFWCSGVSCSACVSSIEVRAHLDDPLWQTFWDATRAISNLLLAILFGVALGNVVRGVPRLTRDGTFYLTFFTDFRVRGQVGLLDWHNARGSSSRECWC